MAAASVGDARPSRMEPSTATIMPSGGTRLRVVIASFCMKVGSPGSGGMRRPISGFTMHSTKM